MNSLRFPLVAALMITLATTTVGMAQVAEGPLEPDARETMILEIMNRGRANPQSDIERCMADNFAVNEVDTEMFAREMQEFQPTQPIFFDLRLLRAARWHALYVSIYDLGHNQDPEMPEFMGRSPRERCNRAGFRGTLGENVSAGFEDPMQVHAMFVTDRDAGRRGPKGPGGMQPGRGHRVSTYRAGWRLVGVGGFFEDHKAVCIDFGESNQRFAGGVIYFDADGDEFYSMGEGIGNTLLSDGQQTIAGFQHGAYTLPVSTNGGEISMQVGPLTFQRPIPPGNLNVKIDFVLTADEYQVLLDLEAEQQYLVDAVRSANIVEATALQEEMKTKYEDTSLAIGYADAAIALEMRGIYMEIAERYQNEHPTGQALLQRRLRRLEHLQQEIQTARWKEVGQDIGEAFVLMGTSGEVSSELTSVSPLDEPGQPDVVEEEAAVLPNTFGFPPPPQQAPNVPQETEPSHEPNPFQLLDPEEEQDEDTAEEQPAFEHEPFEFLDRVEDE